MQVVVGVQLLGNPDDGAFQSLDTFMASQGFRRTGEAASDMLPRFLYLGESNQDTARNAAVYLQSQLRIQPGWMLGSIFFAAEYSEYGLASDNYGRVSGIDASDANSTIIAHDYEQWGGSATDLQIPAKAGYTFVIDHVSALLQFTPPDIEVFQVPIAFQLAVDLPQNGSIPGSNGQFSFAATNIGKTDATLVYVVSQHTRIAANSGLVFQLLMVPTETRIDLNVAFSGHYE